MKTLLGGNQIMTDPVVLDAAGDYTSLDAMASDLINAKIPAQFRNDPRLVVWSVPIWSLLNNTDCIRQQTVRLKNCCADAGEHHCWPSGHYSAVYAG